MPKPLRPSFGRPPLALGSTMLWGVIEFMALCRSRWLRRPRQGED